MECGVLRFRHLVCGYQVDVACRMQRKGTYIHTVRTDAVPCPTPSSGPKSSAPARRPRARPDSSVGLGGGQDSQWCDADAGRWQRQSERGVRVRDAEKEGMWYWVVGEVWWADGDANRRHRLNMGGPVWDLIDPVSRRSSPATGVGGGARRQPDGAVVIEFFAVLSGLCPVVYVVETGTRREAHL